MSRHRDAYWGYSTVTITGHGFTGVRYVTFGKSHGHTLHVSSPTRLTVQDPTHSYGTVTVHVVTDHGTSATNSHTSFTYHRASMSDPIFGHWSARHELSVSARVRAQHHSAQASGHSAHWTPAMGQTALNRARSWLGLPYSWDGGDDGGPTYGACSSADGGGGDFDCEVIGFDCSGLARYAWSPYTSLIHYAASQYGAGRFHPSIAQLEPGDLIFYGHPGHRIGHVVVYAGHGEVVQAWRSGWPVMTTALADVDAGSYRGATRPASSGKQGASPSLSATPARSATAGGWVTLHGQHLADLTSVRIAGHLSYDYRAVSSTSMQVRLPAGRAGTVPVTVSTAWGTSKATTVRYLAPPSVSRISPASGPTAGGTVVTLHGSGFTGTYRVSVGTRRATGLTVRSDSTVTLRVPALAAGSYPLTVVSTWGTTTTRQKYTYVAPPKPKPIPSVTAGRAAGSTARRTPGG